MNRTRPPLLLLLLCAAILPIRPGTARNWGSVDFELASEGMDAAARVQEMIGFARTYQRLRDGDVLASDERYEVFDDLVDGERAFRVEIERYDDEAETTVSHVLFLDGFTLRPLTARVQRPGRRVWQETAYGRDEAVVTLDGAAGDTLDIANDTVEFQSLQLLFLKFLDDPDRMKFSFLFGDSLYHFHAVLKEQETVILGSRSYDTMHVVCRMRGTWYHLAPALHFWIETQPPYRLIRFQSRREVVELVE